MRLAWCRLALRAFVRRWGVYFVVAALVVGAGSGSPLAAMAGVAGWTVVPLARAAAAGPWLLPALLAQALLGFSLLAGARTLLWPAAWRDAEAALPIGRRELLTSDALVVAWALLPWVALQAAGWAALLAARPAWLMPVLPQALAAWALAQALAAAGGVLMLHQLRRVAVGRALVRPRHDQARGARAAGHWFAALLWLPLWRGPARRSGRWLLLGGTALLVPASVPAAWPGATAWGLAALAAAALLLVSRLASLTRAEFSPLFEGAATLPLPPARLERARQGLCLLPLVPAVATAGVALAPLPMRPAVLAAYAVAGLGSCVVEVASRPAVAADKSSRWLFSLVLCLALASEVAL